jgi:putative endonuclease
MYYVYAISSLERNYIYVGLTDNIERRLSEHNSGKNKTTRAYSPFELIYSEECGSRAEARNREKYFKSGIGKEKLRSIRENL